MLAAATALTSSPRLDQQQWQPPPALPQLPGGDLPVATEDKQGEPLADPAEPGQTRESGLESEDGGGAAEPAEASETARPGDGGEAALHLSDRPGSYWALAAAQEASCSAASQGQEGAVMWGQPLRQQPQLGALAEEMTSQCPVRWEGGRGAGGGGGHFSVHAEAPPRPA